MTGDQTEKLLDRALSDAQFMEHLLRDPKGASSELGISLSDDEAKTISGMSADDVRAFAHDYRSATDPSKRRAAC